MSSRSTFAFYRSRVTWGGFVLTGAFMSWMLSLYSPRAWHDTPSLRWLNRVLPFWAMSALFIAYTLLLLTQRLACIIIADYLGLGLYMFGFVALLITLRPDRPTNPFAIAASVLAIVLHYQAGRLAVNQKEGA